MADTENQDFLRSQEAKQIWTKFQRLSHVFMAKEHHGIVFKCLSTVSHLRIQDGRYSGCIIANIFSIKTNRNILLVDNPPFSGHGIT